MEARSQRLTWGGHLPAESPHQPRGSISLRVRGHSGRAARYTEHSQKTLDSVFTFLLFSLLGKQSLAVVAKGGLKPVAILQCWVYKCVLPHPVSNYILFFFFPRQGFSV